MFSHNYWANNSLEVQKTVNKNTSKIIGNMTERGFFSEDVPFIVKEDKKMLKNLAFYYLFFNETRKLEDFYNEFVAKMISNGYIYGVYSKTNNDVKSSPYICSYNELNPVVRTKVSYFYSEFVRLI